MDDASAGCHTAATALRIELWLRTVDEVAYSGRFAPSVHVVRGDGKDESTTSRSDEVQEDTGC